MRRFAAALLLSSVAGLACAWGEAGPVKTVYQRNVHDTLFAISFDGKDGIAVGDFGLQVGSADGGATWTRLPDAFGQLAMFGVVRRQGVCLAAGQQGAIYRSEDCRSWQAVPPVSKSRILAIDVNGSGLAYAVGGFGTVLKSSDWGRIWEPLMPDWKALTGDDFAEPHLYAVHVAAGGRVTVAGEFGLVLQSGDGGASWSVPHKGAASLFALHMQDSGLAYAVGQEGTILKSADHGAHWQKLESGSHSILTGVSASADGQVAVTGIYTILRSRDGGQSWKAEASKQAKSGSHNAIAAGQSQAFYSVGSRGEILFIGQ